MTGTDALQHGATFVQSLSLWGAGAFGAIIGWYVYYVNRYRRNAVQFSDLTTLVGAIGGGAVLDLFPNGGALFGAYGIGLFAGFFGYFVLLLALVHRSENFSSDFLLDGRRKRPADDEYIPGEGQPGEGEHPMLVESRDRSTVVVIPPSAIQVGGSAPTTTAFSVAKVLDLGDKPDVAALSRGFDGSRAFYASGRWAVAQDPKVDQDWAGLSVDLNETRGDVGTFRAGHAPIADGKATPAGGFSGEPRTVWLTEPGLADRRMRLLGSFSYQDPSGRTWIAPSDAIIDGASIPRALWSTLGSPYTGDYRRASIVHDVACEDAGGSHAQRRAADRMFYHACRAGGCSPAKAIVLYIGVRIGAHTRGVPAWRLAEREAASPALAPSAAERRMQADLELAAADVLEQGETDDVREIESRTDRALSAVSGRDLAHDDERASGCETAQN